MKHWILIAIIAALCGCTKQEQDLGPFIGSVWEKAMDKEGYRFANLQFVNDSEVSVCINFCGQVEDSTIEYGTYTKIGNTILFDLRTEKVRVDGLMVYKKAVISTDEKTMTLYYCNYVCQYPDNEVIEGGIEYTTFKRKLNP